MPANGSFRNVIEMLRGDDVNPQGLVLNMHGAFGVGKSRMAYEVQRFLLSHSLYTGGINMFSIKGLEDLEQVHDKISQFNFNLPSSLKRARSMKKGESEQFKEYAKEGMLIVLDDFDNVLKEGLTAYEGLLNSSKE